MNPLVVTFDDVTKRIETMGKLAVDLAKARESQANARFQHAKASGVEFQVVAAYQFLKTVQREGRWLRRQAKQATQQYKRMKRQWRSAQRLFHGKRDKYYALRQRDLVALLQQVMLETADELYEVKIKARSRKGELNFIHNDPVSTPVPNAPANVVTGPELVQFALDRRLVFKPLGPAMGDASKMLKVVNDFHLEELLRLQKLREKLHKGRMSIWDEVPIFGRVVEE
jgi:hypothetical protein